MGYEKLSRAKKEELLTLIREKRIRLSRESFWEFCKTESPTFYQEDRWHLKLTCHVLQAAYEGKLTKHHFQELCTEIAPKWYSTTVDWNRLDEDIAYKKIIMNLPPQHGKSRTLVNFCKWVFGKNTSERIITCSYNDSTASDFSRYTRDGINQTKNLPHEIIYNDIFPETKIKDGHGAFEKWALEGQHFNYLGAGVGGSITSKGGTILIVDDPIKDADTAFNEGALDKIWLWYTSTFSSRVSAEGVAADGEPLEIVNMTRWAKGDICGRILDGEEATEWLVLKMEAYYESVDEMLCPKLLSKKRYLSQQKKVDPVIFQANYHQEPVDKKGCLYQELKEYDSLPSDGNGNILFEHIINYTDTADEGSDWLCSIVAGVYLGEGYVLDVLYTQAPMEETEPETADLLVRNKVNLAMIESNNGGRGFARNVDRIIWEKHQTRSIVVRWFHQTMNKMARILTNSSFVTAHIYFPKGWNYKWPQFYKALTSFKREGKNKNDDAPDTVTGLAEMLQEGFSDEQEEDIQTYQTEVSISPV